MATAAKTSENAWKAKLTWATWECECLREVPAEPDAGEGEEEERIRAKLGKPKRAQEVVVLTILVCFVDFVRPECERIRFRVTRLKNGRLTFCDSRGRDMGTLGTTGLWGTLPPLRAAGTRSLTPTAFKMEAARFVGAERAEEIVREVMTSPRFFSSDLRQM